MRLLWFAVVSACLSGPAFAQSSVWTVTRGDQTLFLGGTVHMLRKEDFPLPAEFDQAYAAAEELWFEVDFAELQSPATIGLLLRTGVLPRGETLETRLSPAAWTALQDYCRDSGLSIETMGRFTPGTLMMNIQLFEITKLGLHQQGVEMYFAQQAMLEGKSTHGLETVEEQLGFIEEVGRENPSEMVLQTLRDLHKGAQMIETAIEAWRTGNLDLMDEAVVQEMERDAPKVAERLIVQRNRNWIPQIETLLASAPVEFVLVGAGHLPGRNGVIALLEARGCVVEQIMAESEIAE